MTRLTNDGCARAVVLAAIVVLLRPAAAADHPLPTALEFDARPIALVDLLEVAPLDLEEIEREDEDRARDGLPPRYAISHDCVVTPDTHGTWERVDRDTLMWRLRVGSPAAVSINLGFTRYVLPEDARLYVYSTDFGHLIRPFTSADNAAHAQLWTPPVDASEVVVELTVDQADRDELELVLGSVNVGYRGFGDILSGPAEARSGSCNVDVICSEGDLWRDEIASVGVISTGGSTFCTGFMVNNVRQDQTPYFMTANHCGINSGNAASLVVFWNYENSTCRTPGSGASGGPGDGSLSQFQTGSFFRSSWSASDFTLVELDEDPNQAWGVTFSGWDATGVDATSAIAIHHPNTDEKRISFEDDPTTTTTYLQTAVPGDGTHVRVADWDLGTTEPGSSGSPLYDQDHRVIGQLHGGFAACGNDSADWYGKVSVSWNGGGSSSTRLSDWLDPDGTGTLVVNTIGAGLQTTPIAGTTHVGLVGGPFTPPSTIYTLTNTGGVPISYRVSLQAGTAPLLLNGGTSDVNGVVAAVGGTVMVTVGLDNPAALAAGVYSTDVLVEDLTNGLSETRTHVIEVGQTLVSVTPVGGLSSSGPIGGPFVDTIVYTVTSERPSPVTVEISTNEAWISLDGGAGPVTLDLNAGVGDSGTVTVAISAAATALPAGLHVGAVDFTNTTGGGGTTSRAVNLDVGRIVASATDTPRSIGDNTKITSDVVIAGDFCIADVDVVIDITHTYIGDLRVTLTSPAGTAVTLHDRTGGSADDIVTTYDDDPGAGVTPPDGPGVLADFNGESTLGTWTLSVTDNATQDTGTLNDWSVSIGPNPNPICPQPQLVYDFPLDTDPGWSTEGQWAFGVPAGLSGDPAAGYTGTNVYGYNLNGDYTDNLAPVYLMTADIDCSNLTSTTLKFRRWLGVESALYDHAAVEVSNNGSTWTTVWDHTGGTMDEQVWTQQSFDISSVADGAATVFVRWSMGPTDGSVVFHGWNLDDIQIFGIAPCPHDCVGGDGIVDVSELLEVLAEWGTPRPHDCDVDPAGGDGVIDVGDLLTILAEWGPC